MILRRTVLAAAGSAVGCGLYVYLSRKASAAGFLPEGFFDIGDYAVLGILAIAGGIVASKEIPMPRRLAYGALIMALLVPLLLVVAFLAWRVAIGALKL